LEQGQDRRRKAAVPSEARLVNPNQAPGRMRDLALFNVAMDSKLRGCDVVASKVDDLAPGGYAADRATSDNRRPAGQLNSN
jgi:hypothetical protein